MYCASHHGKESLPTAEFLMRSDLSTAANRDPINSLYKSRKLSELTSGNFNISLSRLQENSSQSAFSSLYSRTGGIFLDGRGIDEGLLQLGNDHSRGS